MNIAPPIAIIMGSQSDWKIMKYSANMLDTLGIDYEARIISAHRTPDRLIEFSKNARLQGFKLVIAGAGGAAHLPGMIASMTSIPVLGVPIMSKALVGIDSLLSIVQMPAGIPVGTMAIGQAGAINASLLATSILAIEDEDLNERLNEWRTQQTISISEYPKDVSE
ncbi:5-(carboxyamino)imidazole ribonucleotide mutase [Candidatus Liberibacter brunswickensis]|uniref:5-(carboxyamino)imidazole ribonucleotide mutase n=1 Tax=Candidatus Liberibacter brunswickensis TaxID=1968796 RepID=UPI002FDFEB01